MQHAMQQVRGHHCVWRNVNQNTAGWKRPFLLGQLDEAVGSLLASHSVAELFNMSTLFMLPSEEKECFEFRRKWQCQNCGCVTVKHDEEPRVHLGKLNYPLPPRCTLLDMETLMLQRFCSPAGHDPLRSREDGKAGEGEKRQQLLQLAWKLLVYDPPAGLIQPLHECVCFHTGPLNSFISFHHGTSSVDKWTPTGWTPDRLKAAKDFDIRSNLY